jgi:ArsR family transcriptional regulator, arsenate/arsenite/antimonite-responsive transcriptional repressor
MPNVTENAPPVARPDAAERDDRTDRVFRALASRPRREILMLLATGGGRDDARCCSDEEVCACVFAEKLGLGAPTVSHHMKALVDAGLVAAEKRGLWVYYRLRPEAVQAVAQELLVLAGCGASAGCGPAGTSGKGTRR